jgi:Lon-like protease
VRLWRTLLWGRFQQRILVTYFTGYEPPVRRQRLGRGWVGWSLIALLLVGILVVALIPSPYILEKPGPVFDTLGTVKSDGEDVPLIDIPEQETFPTTGSLDLLTVTVAGDRENPLNWFEVAMASLDPSEAVVPVDDIYPKGVTLEQSNKENQLEMENSQKEAIAAALTELGYDFPSTVAVEDVAKKSPADGVIKAKDVIESVNGEPVKDVSELRAKIKANGVSSAATIVLLRDGAEQTVEITPALSADKPRVPILGVIVSAQYEFPFEVNIQLQNVGGPSAGQMFALGIIDKLTKGSLTGDNVIAGTGTISADGTIGAIGGIRQKMWGAVNAGAKYFLAPESNCNEVVGHVPNGLAVIPVKNLHDSLVMLTSIRAGAGPNLLPQCSLSK